MRTHDVPGFVLRTEAVKKYGRSKASFIRDFDKAFEKEDTAFLENFRLYLNDNSMIPGAEVSKDKMNSLQTKQPWVYIKESLLESRYWEEQQTSKASEAKKSKPSAKKKEGSSLVEKLSGVSDAVQIEHENALLKEKLASKQEQIESLENNNQFLQEELRNRRGELKEMTQFVDTVRLGIEASKKPDDEQTSTQQPEQKSPARATVVDAEAADQSFWEKHTPTFHRYLSRS